MTEAKFIISKKKVLNQYNKLKNLGLQVSYSLKTNPDVGKILADETGCWFSVHIENELKHIKEKDYSRILFLAQGWNKEDLDILFKKNIHRFVVDNIQDLDILLKYLENNNIYKNIQNKNIQGKNSQNIQKKYPITLFLRMKLKEMTIHTGKYFVFGIDSKTVNEKIQELKNNSKIDKIGIHVHRKTQNISEWSLIDELSDSLDDKTLENIDYFCIGGGLPARYKNISDKSIGYVLKKIKETKVWLEKFGIKTISEPGRFIAAPSGILETEVKNVIDNNIIINCSVYNASMDTLIVPIKLLVKGELEKEEINEKLKKNKENMFVIKGITPCSQDLFRYRVYLDKKPEIGDKITFLNAGAYNFSTDFCSLKKLKTEIVDEF